MWQIKGKIIMILIVWWLLSIFKRR
jgi:hypothetical protein